jgi:hypothetical protein
VDALPAVSVENLAQGGGSHFAPSAQHAAPKVTEATCIQRFDGVLFVRLYPIAPRILNALTIVETPT